MMKRYLRTSKTFFESNISGYTYLFFAQAAVALDNLFLSQQIHWSFPPAIKIIVYNYWHVVLSFFFIFAAFSTFTYPKEKDTKYLFITINIMISLFIFFS